MGDSFTAVSGFGCACVYVSDSSAAAVAIAVVFVYCYFKLNYREVGQTGSRRRLVPSSRLRSAIASVVHCHSGTSAMSALGTRSTGCGGAEQVISPTLVERCDKRQVTGLNIEQFIEH